MTNTQFDIQLRPKDAAKRMGVCASMFWKLAKNDPSFPRLTRIGKRCTSVSASALEVYLKNKTAEGGSL